MSILQQETNLEVTEIKEIKISATLMALMRSCKRDAEYNNTFTSTKAVLMPIYSYDMSIMDVIRVMIGAYLELLQEPRFEAGHNRTQDVIFELLSMPIEMKRRENGIFKPIVLSDTLKLWQVYEGFIEKMMNSIHLSNVGWCRHVLWPKDIIIKNDDTTENTDARAQ